MFVTDVMASPPMKKKLKSPSMKKLKSSEWQTYSLLQGEGRWRSIESLTNAHIQFAIYHNLPMEMEVLHFPGTRDTNTGRLERTCFIGTGFWIPEAAIREL